LIRGSILISGGALTLLATEAEYRDINADIALSGNEITIRRFAAKSGSGTAELTGQ